MTILSALCARASEPHLDFQRQAEKRLDEDQQGQHEYPLEGRFQGNRTRSIGRHLYLEAEHKGPAQAPPE